MQIKRKREGSEKKKKAKNDAIPHGDMYSTLKDFFCCKNDVLHLKLGGRYFCPGKCNEGWSQGPNHNPQSSGR